MIRALVVDDEAPGRRAVRARLESARPPFEVVGECAGGDEALAAIERERPDVVFLDVRMPGRDGFEVLEAMGAERRPLVVFVTAHGDEAARAFEVHAVDYVLKPFDEARFADTLTRVRARLSDEPGALATRLDALLAALGREASPSGRPPLDRFAVRSRGRVRIVRARAVDWIQRRATTRASTPGARRTLWRRA